MQNIRWDPPEAFNREPRISPGTSLPFDGTAERTAHIVGWAAAPGVVSASLDGTANGGVNCTLRVRTADGEQLVPWGQSLARAEDGSFSVVANVEADAALAELARLCVGEDPFAPRRSGGSAAENP